MTNAGMTNAGTTDESGWHKPELSGVVALVTGASRGVGRGVACALGDAGATVYVTGRSRGDGSSTENLPGTIDETADEVTRRGGRGVAIGCDHFDDAQTAAVFEQIRSEQGRLDVLVNNAWAGYERADEAKFDASFWTQPVWRWDLFAGSLRAQYVASQHAVPLMLEAGGLLVNMSFTDGETYLGQVAYDVSKTSSDRMAMGMAQDLRKTSITALSLHPGLVRTERVAAAWQALGDGPASVAHSPEYAGRAVAWLYADPSRAELAGRRVAVGELAERYDFDDVDGRRPAAFRLEGRMSLATRMQRLNGLGSPAKPAGPPTGAAQSTSTEPARS